MNRNHTEREDHKEDKRLSSRLFCVLCALCGSVLWGSVVQAHEIGTTRVSVTLDDRTYSIDIVTDAAALADKLQTVSGRSPSSDANPVRLQAMLSTFDGIFRGRLSVAFDGVARPPTAITYSVAPPGDAASAPLATIRVSGDTPHDARAFTWTYAWTFTPYALTVKNAGSDRPVTEWLEGGQASSAFAVSGSSPQNDRLANASRYLALGFTHIVPYGLDHMLFVLGIFLLTRRIRSVLWQVSAFTVAHSITLGLSMYGLVAAPPAIVEPLIAVSIAYVAIENVFISELKSWRVALVFGFGLLHGMGFAGALKELGLPRSEFLTALLTFNLGVEAGQLAVIGAAFLAVGWQWGNQSWYRHRIVVPASLLIACTAVYWTYARWPHQ
jgi:hydrogenase/urease accessory protein HupE